MRVDFWLLHLLVSLFRFSFRLTFLLLIPWCIYWWYRLELLGSLLIRRLCWLLMNWSRSLLFSFVVVGLMCPRFYYLRMRWTRGVGYWREVMFIVGNLIEWEVVILKVLRHMLRSCCWWWVYFFLLVNGELRLHFWNDLLLIYLPLTAHYIFAVVVNKRYFPSFCVFLVGSKPEKYNALENIS